REARREILQDLRHASVCVSWISRLIVAKTINAILVEARPKSNAELKRDRNEMGVSRVDSSRPLLVLLEIAYNTGTGLFRGRIVMSLNLEVEREDDGRWIAEVPELPGVLAYGQGRQDAVDRVQALALRVIADRLEHGEPD